jgi:tRNA (cytidine/uridine-2'-O-)-methyltransferase
MRRAGLDYREWARMSVHDSLGAFEREARPVRIFPCSTRAGRRYADVRFLPGDALLFGPETRGLPARILESFPSARRLRIPMVPGNRSLNLSNAVAVLLYEAWRQHGFAGGA